MHSFINSVVGFLSILFLIFCARVESTPTPQKSQEVLSRLTHPTDQTLRFMTYPAPPNRTDEDIRLYNDRLDHYCNHHTTASKGRTIHPVMKTMLAFRRPITYFDIGAHRGRTAVPVLFCTHAPHRVIAVEPISDNVAAIYREKAMLGQDHATKTRFTVHHAAMSNKTGTQVIYFPHHRPDNAALSQKASTVVFKTGSTSERVKTLTGDKLLAQERAVPQVIKLDVQGAELLALKGMDNFLRRRNNIVIIAENDGRLQRSFGFADDEVYQYLKSHGFKAFCNPRVTMKDDQPFINDEEYNFGGEIPCGDVTYWKPGPGLL